MANAGRVVRVGSTVRRPVEPWTAAVHALLQHFERVGFAGAPRVHGTDAEGRAVLDFVEGDVGLPPYPAWTADDALLVSVAQLQRAAHEAARSFVPPPDAPWQPTMIASGYAGALVTHNDLCVENVVVRAGRAVAFIDWDFAAPVDPVLDLAIAARHWIPLRDPVDLDPERRGVDQVARFALFADAHSLTRAERERVVDAAGAFLDQALVSMRARAESGLPGYVAVWDAGYEGQNRRSRAWLEAHRTRLV
jgi:Ser/Thr protein kinase RdoA (MazF antagonist)